VYRRIFDIAAVATNTMPDRHAEHRAASARHHEVDG
jgi:hypothetical protein